MTTWYIIRHAEKEEGDFYNPRLRHQDPPLSEAGRRHSRKLHRLFFDKPISAIYVSAYRRTWQTIEPVAQSLRLTPQVDDRLNEIDNGCIEGMADQEIRRKFPDIWSAYIERKTDFRFPQGETGAEAQGRIISFLEEKRRQHGAGDLVLVSHDGLIRLLMCYVVDIPVYRRGIFRVDTCGMMEIAYQQEFESWKLIRFNQMCR